MSKSKEYKSSSLYLLEMREACRKIAEYLQRTNKEEFLKCLESNEELAGIEGAVVRSAQRFSEEDQTVDLQHK